ncbi:RNase H domain protein [Calycina marina]|uniref:RNase H domain protein n=1 Tax=Calycina marina TaxID=1763456 RepID=A0A9P7YWH0_9HELO|nr:RNase H domain protein [Calycina marina]
MLPKFPGIFHPPGKSEDTPQALFRTEHRLIRAADSREILIYATGTCLSNGQDLPKAGCCFVYRSSAYTQRGDLTHGGTIRFRLEYKGPSGQHYRQTGNRAALRSVLAALQFRDWSKDCNESWRSIVIATDSKYVASNATERVKIWEGENWLTYDDELKCHVDIKNQDLWNSLMERIAELQSAGVRIRFWNITEDLNARTINFALQACSFHDEANFRVPSYFGPTGVLYMRNRI